jgi:DNA-binding XRE family transcriptional regulator
VVVPRSEFERLVQLARIGSAPEAPPPGAVHEYPAVEYARASIAREIVRRRTQAGITQRDLAERAGIRVETLCRVETGKNTPSTATIAAIDSALSAFERSRKRAHKRA